MMLPVLSVFIWRTFVIGGKVILCATYFVFGTFFYFLFIAGTSSESPTCLIALVYTILLGRSVRMAALCM